MSSSILSLFRAVGVVAPKSVNSVMSAFNKTIDDLDEVARREDAETIRLRDQITELEAAQRAAAVERQRAETLRDRLSALAAA